MASYRFADPSMLRNDRVGGRLAFPKDFKTNLVDEYGSKCNVCSGKFEERYLQIDHRVPYEVAGDTDADHRDVKDYQLLDGSCNRAKSWSCEQCPNWTKIKDPAICATCYWANPEEYEHVATRNIRRLDVTWDENEVNVYDELQEHAEESDTAMPDFVKAILKKIVE